MEVRKVKVFNGHTGPIYSLFPSHKPGHLLSCASEGIVAEWNLQSGEGKAVAKTSGAIFSFRLFPERKLLLLGMQSGDVVFVDIDTQETLRRVQLHKKSIFDFLPLPDGKHVLVSSEDGALSIWNLDQMDHIHYQKISEKSVRTLAISPDGSQIAAGGTDKNIRIFDPGLTQTKSWIAHENSVFRLVFSPDGQQVISTGRDAQIRSWNVTEDYEAALVVPAHMYAVNDLIYSPDGKYVVSGSMDKSIKIWDSQTLKLLKVINHEKNACHWNGVNRLLWMDDSLFSCSDDRLIMRWEID